MILGKLLEEVYRACGLQVLRRVATGGSTTTVEDTGIKNRRGDGYYAQGANGGHILFISQTTDFVAPQGVYGEISAFTGSTTTPTFTVPAMNFAAQAGDIYAVMKPTIQLYEMIGCVNDGLRRLPPLELVDETLATLPDTLEYTLEFAVGAYQILGVEIGNAMDGWQDANGYTIVPVDEPGPDILSFTTQPPYDTATPEHKTIRIRYLMKHYQLNTYGNYIEKSVPDDLAIAVCTEAAWELLMRKRPSWYADKTKMTIFKDVRRRSQEAQANNPIRIKPASLQRRINLGEM